MTDIRHKFYADENFHKDVIVRLRLNGFDIITALEDGKANQEIPDEKVMVRAVELGRCILTHDKDFKKLHRINSSHFGIIHCTSDFDSVGQAQRIVEACSNHTNLEGVLLKIYRPSK